jgi:hypothetical protein
MLDPPTHPFRISDFGFWILDFPPTRKGPEAWGLGLQNSTLIGRATSNDARRRARRSDVPSLTILGVNALKPGKLRVHKIVKGGNHAGQRPQDSALIGRATFNKDFFAYTVRQTS